jgi:hypothetical protein
MLCDVTQILSIYHPLYGRNPAAQRCHKAHNPRHAVIVVKEGAVPHLLLLLVGTVPGALAAQGSVLQP